MSKIDKVIELVSKSYHPNASIILSCIGGENDSVYNVSQKTFDAKSAEDIAGLVIGCLKKKDSELPVLRRDSNSRLTKPGWRLGIKS